MRKGKLVTKKTVAWINGVEVPATVRMFRSAKKPKSIGRPHVMSPEQRAEFNAKFKGDKPLWRPTRKRMAGDK